MSRAFWSKIRVKKVQEETQGFLMRCEVADDSVVVMKSRPVKAGNRLEDKTGTTCRKCRQGPLSAKSLIGMRRDEVHSKFLQIGVRRKAGHKVA